MAYSDAMYKKRRALEEKIAENNLHSNERTEDNNVNLFERIVYGVVGVLLLLALARIILRVTGADFSRLGILVNGLTDPYMWVFNSLFAGTPHLLLAAVEPGSLVSLVFFPLLGWGLIGLAYEIRNGKYYRISRTGIRR